MATTEERNAELMQTLDEWFWTAFPDQHLDNRPYRIFLASGDYTCSVAHFSGTMTGPLKTWAGDEMQPTGKSFAVDFYTVAQWDDGQIVEENLMYDLGDVHATTGAERLIRRSG